VAVATDLKSRRFQIESNRFLTIDRLFPAKGDNVRLLPLLFEKKP
jgi:hypothetical protein